ncbi:MAG: DUF418 domain-containing protein [Deltaproteobacteria bacterium]|nr:DUF418 domain-containing protein [Deltaproteobacteria bacterium]
MSAGRLQHLDAMRGFALAGIAFVNLTWFSGYAVMGGPERAALPTAALDPFVRGTVHVLVDGKFYSLFALLFGVGFGLWSRRPRSHGWTRRMLVLLALGLAHASALWFGDILSLYAVVGLLLPATRWLHSSALLGVATTCLLMPMVLIVAQTCGVCPNIAADGLGPAAQLDAFAHGNYSQMLSANAGFLEMRWRLALDEGRLLKLAGMFGLGVLACRRGLVDDPHRHRATLGSIARWGLGVGLPAELAALWLGPGTPAGAMVSTVGVPTLALGYAATAALHPPLTLAPAGRLSLSNYLLQSLVGALVFYGLGLGMWGQLGMTALVGFALVMIAVQVRLSRWWAASFGRGPVERLWRAAAGSRPRGSAAKVRAAFPNEADP